MIARMGPPAPVTPKLSDFAINRRLPDFTGYTAGHLADGDTILKNMEQNETDVALAFGDQEAVLAVLDGHLNATGTATGDLNADTIGLQVLDVQGHGVDSGTLSDDVTRQRVLAYLERQIQLVDAEAQSAFGQFKFALFAQYAAQSHTLTQEEVAIAQGAPIPESLLEQAGVAQAEQPTLPVPPAPQTPPKEQGAPAPPAPPATGGGTPTGGGPQTGGGSQPTGRSKR